jgi:hypothetical protein
LGPFLQVHPTPPIRAASEREPPKLEASIERNPLTTALVVAGLMLGVLGMLGRAKIIDFAWMIGTAITP